MAAKDISVKKYLVRLSGEEREQLEALIRKGKSAAQRLLKARISTSTRACTVGLRPKPTCRNIFKSAHLRFTRWC
jgi:hypothetical protein